MVINNITQSYHGHVELVVCSVTLLANILINTTYHQLVVNQQLKLLVDPPWSLLARWVTYYSCLRHRTTQPTEKVSNGLLRLCIGLYSALQDFPTRNYSFQNLCGSTLDYSGLVNHLLSQSHQEIASITFIKLIIICLKIKPKFHC